MDFFADMHTHTVASTHAFSTITENAAAAKKAGIRFLAMTDHGPAMPDSPHEWHFYSMKNLPRQIDGVYIVRGMEANIMDYDGNLDVTEPLLLGCLEWIVASFHWPCCKPGTRAENTNAYIKALQNPKVDVIGHSESVDYDYDMNEVARVCREENKLIEINAPRLFSKEGFERYRYILDACANEGAKVIVDSDAHYHASIGDFAAVGEYIESCKFPPELVVNASEERMRNYLISRKGNIFE